MRLPTIIHKLRPPILIVCLLGLQVPSICAQTANQIASIREFVPPDAGILVCIQWGDSLTGGPESEALQKLLDTHPILPISWLNELENSLGIDPLSVDRLTGFGLNRKDTSMSVFGVISARDKIDSDDVFAWLGDDPRKVFFAGRTFYQSRTKSRSVFFQSENSILTTRPGNMREYFKLGWAEEGYHKESILQATTAVDDGSLAVAFADGTIIRYLLESLTGDSLAPLKDAIAAHLTATTEDDKLVIRVKMDFSDPPSDAAIEAFEAVPQMFSQYIALAGEKMPEFLRGQAAQYPNSAEVASKMATVLQATITGLENTNIQQEKESLSFLVNIETREPVTVAALLMSLLPRPAMQ